MNPDDNKRCVRRVAEEIINERRLDVIDDVFAEAFVNHDPLPGIPPDRSGVHRFFTGVFQAFPDLRSEIADIIAEGDRVMNRVILRGTHHGEFMTAPPTGRVVVVSEMNLYRLEAGRVVERWARLDALSLMRQLGLLPSSGN